jgi:hypothetical protein
MRHALARDTVAARVAGFPRVAVARPDLKQAAVAVCVTEVAGAGTGAEVAAVHHIPLADLDVEPRLITIPQSQDPVIQLPLLGGYLHAPTAAVVYQFCRIACRDAVTRVAHYEQPVFAWR